MNVFEAVRESVTARRAAEACGIRVNRSGMACCPFHRDRHPSMKLDKRFHCFGCQEDGDSIDFAARFYGLSKKDAAIKLAGDFGISYDDYRRGEENGRSKKKERKCAPRAQKKTREQLLEQTERGMFRIISDYYHQLRKWKEEYAPRSDEEEWHPLFVEALSNMTIVEYLMDTLLDAAAEEKIDLMNDYRGKRHRCHEQSRARSWLSCIPGAIPASGRKNAGKKACRETRSSRGNTERSLEESETTYR